MRPIVFLLLTLCAASNLSPCWQKLFYRCFRNRRRAVFPQLQTTSSYDSVECEAAPKAEPPTSIQELLMIDDLVLEAFKSCFLDYASADEFKTNIKALALKTPASREMLAIFLAYQEELLKTLGIEDLSLEIRSIRLKLNVTQQALGVLIYRSSKKIRHKELQKRLIASLGWPHLIS